MAGYDLSINMSELHTLASDLKAIEDEFKNADDHSEDAAHATGDDELRDRVQDFADKWRIKREDMLENVVKLRGILDSIVGGFTDTDEKLAKALEDKADKATRK